MELSRQKWLLGSGMGKCAFALTCAVLSLLVFAWQPTNGEPARPIPASGAPSMHQAVSSSAQESPFLAVGSPFALAGGALTLTVSGTPGAFVRVVESQVPVELHRGLSGIQFYKTGTENTLATGAISENGIFTTTLPISAQAPLGAIFYVQAISKLNGKALFSNAVAYRVQEAPPAGARKTQSMAVTPDGTLAYVADNLDGVVSVVDAVNDTKLTDLPVTVGAGDVPYRPVRIAVDPEGRHAFVSNVAASTIAVIDTATSSVSAQIPVPRGCRGIGFDFRNGKDLIYVANETQNSVLVFKEAPVGTFTAVGSIAMQTYAPGPLLVLPDGRLVVGTRARNNLEFLAPDTSGGSQTLGITPLPGTPYELGWDGSSVLVSTFAVQAGGSPGTNRVLRVSPASHRVTKTMFDNLGTDYRSMAVLPALAGTHPLIVLGASGTGTVIVADGSTQAVLANIELTGGFPDATPQDVAIINDAASQPYKIYVLDLFRETVRPIILSGGPPYTVGAEIPLAWSGKVRVPLTGDLSDADNGEWRFREVATLGGTAFKPNPVTCNTCHTDGASDNSQRHEIQVPAPWGTDVTAPYFWDGHVPTLVNLVAGALKKNNETGNPPAPGSAPGLLNYLSAHQPPSSIYLAQDGTMTPDQQAGKAIFEGVAHCSQCHAAPAFIPPLGNPPTIKAGIGTGLAPANVPSLRGAWATAPYLHDGSALTLMDVLTINPSDVHGQDAAPLTDTQRQQLVEYLQTL